MGHYLVSLELDGRLCLVIGGGQVAERKVCTLLACGALVHIVGPELTPLLRDIVEAGRAVYRQARYSPADLNDVFLVICATDDKEVNRQVAEDCAARNLLVNVVDEPEKCSFFVPAVVKRGELSLAVSTGGKSPLLARKLREELETTYGPQYGIYLDLLADLRKEVINNVSDKTQKKEILERMVADEILDALRCGRIDLVKERLDSAYRSSRA